MRVLVCVMLLLAGCSSPDPETAPSAPGTSCDGATREATLWLGPGHTLSNATPEPGSLPGNGFDEAFLVDDMDEWRSAPWPSAMRIVGNVSLEFWVRNDGTPAPVVLGGAPGQGYHFFNQFGTDGGFVADYGREYAEAAPAPGSVHHYAQTIAMPPGGLHVERGQSLRLLLTRLVVDAQGTGQHILFGGDTPSHIRFEHHCMLDLDWREVDRKKVDVAVEAHQGLITGAVPADGRINYATVDFTLQEATQRLTIRLEQKADSNPLKDDMDLSVLDAAGREVVSIGSPYADEVGTFYATNLDAMMPPGEYTVRVDSYSGHAYRGAVTILQERAVLPSGL